MFPPFRRLWVSLVSSIHIKHVVVDDIRSVGKKRRLQVQRLVFAHFRFEDTGQLYDVLMYQSLRARDRALREQRRIRNSPPSVKVMVDRTVGYGGRCVSGRILILMKDCSIHTS